MYHTHLSGILLAALAAVALLVPAIGTTSIRDDPPAESARYQEFIKEAEDLKVKAEKVEEEARECLVGEYLSEAYDGYRNAIKLVRERKAVLKKAAKEAHSSKVIQELSKSLKANTKWENSLQETIDLLYMSR